LNTTPKERGQADTTVTKEKQVKASSFLPHSVRSLAPPARAGVVSFVFKLFSPENIWAFVLFLIVMALIIFTTDSSPVWIYQGF